MFNLMRPRKERARELARPGTTALDLLRDDFATLFDRVFPPWPFEATWDMEPWGMEMEEKENEVVVTAEMPGFEPGEIEVTVRGNELAFKAEHKEAKEKEEKMERRHARLVKTMTLPADIEPEKVEARYRNGVLEVHLPLSAEAKPRRIEVKT